jgi:hypothetical protein
MGYTGRAMTDKEIIKEFNEDTERWLSLRPKLEDYIPSLLHFDRCEPGNTQAYDIGGCSTNGTSSETKDPSKVTCPKCKKYVESELKKNPALSAQIGFDDLKESEDSCGKVCVPTKESIKSFFVLKNKGRK